MNIGRISAVPPAGYIQAFAMYVGRKPGADFQVKYQICRKPNGLWEILFRGKRTQGTGLSAFYRDAKQRLRSRLEEQQRLGIAV